MKNHDEAIDYLEGAIGYRFEDRSNISKALTHSSYTNEFDNKSENYERLEFLGDAVLGMIIAQYIFERFDSMKEGLMTRIRAAVVCEKSLSEAALTLGYDKVLIMGKGEIYHGGQTKPSILADVFEAVLASVYLDGGLEAAKKIVLGQLVKKIDETVAEDECNDTKSALQEMMQKNGEMANIEYVTDDVSGPAHDRTFLVSVKINDQFVASGAGKSKKAAQKEAARIAIEKIVEEDRGNENFKI